MSFTQRDFHFPVFFVFCFLFFLREALFIIFFFNFWVFIYLFIYLFIYGCVGSSFLCEGFL